jgi:hypothetical protein
VGINKETGEIHLEINGLKTPQSAEATRICREDLNEVVTSFLQDTRTLERGLFDKENTIPEELTQLRMGKIVSERYPELTAADQETIRQHAVAAINITQQAKLLMTEEQGGKLEVNTSFIDGVRKFMNVRDLDIDLIDRINPFDTAYAILAKSMNEKTLRQVQISIAAKKVNLPEDEARALALRAVQFKNERGRSPDILAADAWEQKIAGGVAAYERYQRQKLKSKVGEANHG